MITIGIASIPSRSAMLEQVLDSLTGQADQIFVGLNYGDEPRPDYLDKYSNVFWWTTNNHHGDAEKFAMVHACEGYYIAWDDDLIMPDECAAYLITGVMKYEGLVSLHGRVYPRPVNDFRHWQDNYRCLGRVDENRRVDLIGSGCCCFHIDLLRVSMSDFKTRNMADLWLSKLATEQGIPMMVLAHERDYLTYLNPTETIWRSTKDFSGHTAILKSFIK